MKKLLCLIAFVSVRFICCTTFIIFFSFHARAQEMSVRTYTVKDGLPSTNVIGTFQDKLGYLWVSTAEGPCRFDGKSFDKDGFLDGRANVVFEDSHLRYWAAFTQGIC